MPKAFSLVCLDVNRNEEVFNSSSIARGFVENCEVTVDIYAVIFVPEKFVIALCRSPDQVVADNYPHMVLLTNDWYQRTQATRFIESAVSRKSGPFHDAVARLQRME